MRSVSINDPGQGLADGALDDCQVLIWWGHVRQAEIAPETGQSIVKRIKDGRAFADRASFGPLVDAVRRGDVRADALDVAEKAPGRGQ